MTTALKITNLSKKYGSLEAVKQVSFEVYPGEIFGLLGPNGAGKTSIISIITSLEKPSEGNVEVFSYDVVREAKQAKALTGCVPQELINHGFFSLEEIMHIHSGYYGCSNNSEMIEYLIEKLSLSEHRKKKVKQLSGGMKRRLLIAKAMLHKPRLLLLDEPTAGVDIELRNDLWDFMKEMRDAGVAIVLTTHYLEEAEALCDRVGFLQEGRLKKMGPTQELVKDFTQREVIFSLKEPIATVQHQQLSRQTPHQLEFQMPSFNTLGDLISTLPIDKISDLSIREGKLEDALKKVLDDE